MLLDRPTYHLRPNQGWVNDPNGPLYHRGVYHMFFQHLVTGCTWDFGLVWGHCISTDLIHWEELVPALVPSRGTVDQDGCFSGCAVVDTNGVPTILYTGVRLRSSPTCGPLPPEECDLGLPFIESQCAAVPADPDDPRLEFWVKSEVPWLPLPPPNLQLIGWRDPYIIGRPDDPLGDGFWTLVIGSGFKDIGGAVLMYKSRQLTHGWFHVGELCTGTSIHPGFMWECPLFAKLQPLNCAVLPYSLCHLQTHHKLELKDTSPHPPAPHSDSLSTTTASSLAATPADGQLDTTTQDSPAAAHTKTLTPSPPPPFLTAKHASGVKGDSLAHVDVVHLHADSGPALGLVSLSIPECVEASFVHSLSEPDLLNENTTQPGVHSSVIPTPLPDDALDGLHSPAMLTANTCQPLTSSVSASSKAVASPSATTKAVVILTAVSSCQLGPDTPSDQKYEVPLSAYSSSVTPSLSTAATEDRSLAASTAPTSSLPSSFGAAAAAQTGGNATASAALHTSAPNEQDSAEKSPQPDTSIAAFLEPVVCEVALPALDHFFCMSPDSVSNPTYYWLGPRNGDNFIIDQAVGPFKLDLGDVLYAPNTLQDAQGRLLLWGWLQEGARKVGVYDYSGCLSVPRVLWLQHHPDQHGSPGLASSPPTPLAPHKALNVSASPLATNTPPVLPCTVHLYQQPLPELTALRDTESVWLVGSSINVSGEGGCSTIPSLSRASSSVSMSSDTSASDGDFTQRRMHLSTLGISPTKDAAASCRSLSSRNRSVTSWEMSDVSQRHTGAAGGFPGHDRQGGAASVSFAASGAASQAVKPASLPSIIIRDGCAESVPMLNGPFLDLELDFICLNRQNSSDSQLQVPESDAIQVTAGGPHTVSSSNIIEVSPPALEPASEASPAVPTRPAASGLLIQIFQSGLEVSATVLYHWDTCVLEVVWESAADTASPSRCSVLLSNGGGVRRVGGKLLRPPAPGTALQLRVLIDYSLLEVFTGGGEVLSTRVYRGSAGQGTGPGLSLISYGCDTELVAAAGYEMSTALKPVDTMLSVDGIAEVLEALDLEYPDLDQAEVDPAAVLEDDPVSVVSLETVARPKPRWVRARTMPVADSQQEPHPQQHIQEHVQQQLQLHLQQQVQQQLQQQSQQQLQGQPPQQWQLDQRKDHNTPPISIPPLRTFSLAKSVPISPTPGSPVGGSESADEAADADVDLLLARNPRTVEFTEDIITPLGGLTATEWLPHATEVAHNGHGDDAVASATVDDVVAVEAPVGSPLSAAVSRGFDAEPGDECGQLSDVSGHLFDLGVFA